MKLKAKFYIKNLPHDPKDYSGHYEEYDEEQIKEILQEQFKKDFDLKGKFIKNFELIME